MAYDKQSIDLSKDIWKDARIALNHQYDLAEAFNPINRALCNTSHSDYKKWTNLNNYQDPITKNMPENFNTNLIDEQFYFRAYKANINDHLCKQNEDTYAQIFSAKQTSTSDPLELYSYRISETRDFRTKFVFYEDTSTSNPYGVLTFDYQIAKKPNSEALYTASVKSERIDSSTTQIQTVGWNDSSLVFPSLDPGIRSELYVSKIIHSETNNNGYGTVHGYQWGQMNVQLGENVFGNYPDGIPDYVFTINFAYNDNYLLRQRLGTSVPTSVDERSLESKWAPSPEICIDRSKTWEYVPWWFGYGVYNESGDRISEDSFVAASYESAEIEGYGIWSGNLQLKGTMIVIPNVCRNMKDGSVVDGRSCADNGLGDGYYMAANGYENIALFDVPDGTVLTDASENEYYVRILKPRKVYASADPSSCADLEIKATISTPDHKLLNYLNDSDVPPSGAVIINQYQTGDTINDPNYSGKVYIANQDTDGDGILNYMDAFPEDSTKSKDDDYDGIADSIDDEVKQFTPTFNKYLDLDLFSNFSH